MRIASPIMTCLAALICLAGCEGPSTTTIMQYGPRHMTYSGSSQQFNDACRAVLYSLSNAEEEGGNSVRYPHYGEGVSSHKNNEDVPIAVEAYMKTKDEEGAEYKITTIRLGKKEPIVILESTSSDPHKLINALNAEFHISGISVRQYQ
jgi:O-acetyl-ADP-ribose deacetylase (regulator of RNase III)